MEDTETYVVVDLTSKQNALFELLIVTSFPLLLLNQFTALTGAFAMMLRTHLYDTPLDFDPDFYEVVLSCVALVVALTWAFIAALRWRGVLAHI